MRVNSYSPHPALREYVLNTLTVDAILPEGMIYAVTPYPPSPFQSLMFYLNHPISMGRVGDDSFYEQPLTLVTGPQISRVNVRVHQQLRSIRVDFLPGALNRIVGVPMHELLDGGFDAALLFGTSINNLSERLCNEPDLETAKNLIEHYLIQCAGKARSILPFDHAMSVMLKNDGNLSVTDTASLSCLSIKQFERKCFERIGMTPKMYSRILRFSNAYRKYEALPHLTWTDIAHASGYYDQMHLIRDFKTFAGVNPGIIAEQLRSTPLRMQKDMG